MADIFEINTLAQASSYLEDTVGGNWSERQVFNEAIKNNLRLCASNPEWVAPGIGELKKAAPSIEKFKEIFDEKKFKEFCENISNEELAGGLACTVLSDGLVGLNSFTLSTLIKHGKANLINLPGVVGDAPWIDFTHLRISGDELKKLSATLASKAKAAPAAKVKVAKQGIAKQRVATAFDGLLFTRDRWIKNLATPPKWLKADGIRVSKGSKSASALWNPVLIAIALLDKKIPITKLNAVFNLTLKEWANDWKNATALERENG